jgi:hypothetical protein
LVELSDGGYSEVNAVGMLTAVRSLGYDAAPKPSRARAEGETEMIPFIRTVRYRCCMAIALISGIAALTITVAIATNKLLDPQTLAIN